MTPQMHACDPSKNIWVSASAGTGKTKTLIDRLLRLLLRGDDASKIICLTYTRTAAAEMKERLQEKMALWAGADDDTLFKEILALHEPVCAQTIHIARSLLDQYLYNNKNIKIQTLHSFCEEFLRKYALEAGISPFFTIIDDTQEDMMYGEAFEGLMQKSHECVHEILRFISLTSLQDLLKEFIHFEQRDGYLPLAPEIPAYAEKVFHFQLSQDDIEILKSSSKPADQKLGQDLEDAQKNPSIFSRIFLTQSGDMRKKLCSTLILEDLKERLESLQREFFESLEHQKTQTLFLMSKYLHESALLYHENLGSFKSKAQMYTFSDIIIYALKVLQESASYSPWVLMNLSNTISHILIDEAQDTSPLQWRFLQELTELVFDQELGRKSSLFVVGDFKQSIFSFQGARPEIFNDVYTTLKNALALQGHALEKIDLNTSFRSTPAILNFVDSVFQGELKQGVWEEDSLIHHAHREGEGKIDIFPPCSDPLQAALLIQKIACPDTMILFRRRSHYVKQVLREVEKLGLETSGLDRFNLLEDFAILDLLALARVCANPLDDMAVALTLISPLFRWSETDLGKAPLFETPKIQETLYPFIHLASQMSVLEFFVEVLQKMRYKQNFFQSYGRSCAVVFEAFFHEIRIFESECASHMSIFLSWIEGRHLEVKRDTSKGNIRPMTIHGSKGSEASTVILLEADSTPRLQERLFLYKDTVFWTPHKELWPEAFKTLREHHKDKNIQEYNRLLYVALTRARDHLYIFATEKGSELSWYQGLSAS